MGPATLARAEAMVKAKMKVEVKVNVKVCVKVEVKVKVKVKLTLKAKVKVKVEMKMSSLSGVNGSVKKHLMKMMTTTASATAQPPGPVQTVASRSAGRHGQRKVTVARQKLSRHEGNAQKSAIRLNQC